MRKHRSATQSRRSTKELVEVPGPKKSVAPRVPVVLIDSSALFREGLMRILRRTRFEVIEAAGAVAALSTAHARAPELVLIGPGEDAVVTTCEIEACRQRFPSARLIVLHDRLDRPSPALMLESSVSAYIGKAVTTEVLLASLELVILGAIVFSAPASSCDATSAEYDVNPLPTLSVKTDQPAKGDAAKRLSVREIDILHCLVQGESNKVIARKFQITEATVKVHIKAILRKIRAANRTQAAIWAINHLPQHQTSLAPEPPGTPPFTPESRPPELPSSVGKPEGALNGAVVPSIIPRPLSGS